MEERIIESSGGPLPVLVPPTAGMSLSDCLYIARILSDFNVGAGRSRLSSAGMLQTPLLPSILESSGGGETASEVLPSVQRCEQVYVLRACESFNE